jgi:hypothetical protein
MGREKGGRMDLSEQGVEGRGHAKEDLTALRVPRTLATLSVSAAPIDETN